MARKKTKTEAEVKEEIVPAQKEAEKQAVKYAVELLDRRTGTKSFLADKKSGGVAKFSSESEAVLAAQDFLNIINGAIPFSYLIRKI